MGTQYWQKSDKRSTGKKEKSYPNKKLEQYNILYIYIICIYTSVL